MATIAFCLLALVASLRAEVYLWGNVAMGGGGFVSGLVAHPSAGGPIYARTDVGGAYRWDEAASQWIPLQDWLSEGETSFLGVESIGLDPRDPNRVYLLAGTSYWNSGKTAILRSMDRGATWKVIDVSAQFRANGNGANRGSGEKLAVDPNLGSIVFSGSRAHGLWKSTNSGDTWQKVTSFPVSTTPDGSGISFVMFVPSSGTVGNATRTVFVGVSRPELPNLFRSDDGGVSWTGVSNTPAGVTPFRAVLSGTKLLVTHNRTATAADRTTVMRYDVNTGAAEDITPPSTAFYQANTQSYGGIAVDPTNPNRILVTTRGYYNNQTKWGWGDAVALSLDGGATWRRVLDNSSPLDTNGIPFAAGHALHWASSLIMDPANPKRIFITSGHGVIGTDALGDTAATTTWKFRAHGIEESVPMDIAPLPNGGIASAIYDYDSFIHTDPAVYVNSNRPEGGSTVSITFAAANPQVFARVNSSLWWSENGGTSWTALPVPYAGAKGGYVALSRNGDVLLYQPSGSTVTYRTTTKGQSWAPVAGLAHSGRIVADPVNNGKFYSHDRNITGYLYRSTDGGVSFQQAAFVAKYNGGHLRAAPGREGDLWLPLGTGDLTRSTDSGSTFALLPSVDHANAVGFGMAAPGRTYPTIFIWGRPRVVTGTVNGVYRSTDLGVTWVRVNDDSTEYGGLANGGFLMGDLGTFGRVYMSTAGRGIAYGEFDYELSVTPQPWRGLATITYSLPSDYVSGTPVTFEVTGSESSGINKVFTHVSPVSGANSIRMLHSKYYPAGTYLVKMLIGGRVVATLSAQKTP